MLVNTRTLRPSDLRYFNYHKAITWSLFLFCSYLQAPIPISKKFILSFLELKSTTSKSLFSTPSLLFTFWLHIAKKSAFPWRFCFPPSSVKQRLFFSPGPRFQVGHVSFLLFSLAHSSSYLSQSPVLNCTLSDILLPTLNCSVINLFPILSAPFFTGVSSWLIIILSNTTPMLIRG